MKELCTEPEGKPLKKPYFTEYMFITEPEAELCEKFEILDLDDQYYDKIQEMEINDVINGYMDEDEYFITEMEINDII